MKQLFLISLAAVLALAKHESPVVPIKVIRRPNRASQRFGALSCNHDIKKSFTAMSLDYFDPKFLRATPEMIEVCPNVIGSCCSAREMQLFQSQGHAYVELVEFYLTSLQSLYKSVSRYNTTTFLENFRNVRNKPESCISKDFMPRIEMDILNLGFLAKKVIDKVGLFYKMIYQYYMGFMCSMCNVRQQESFRVVDNVELKIELDIAMCEGLIQEKQMFYEISEIVFRIYDISKALSCLYTDSYFATGVVEKLRKGVNNKAKRVRECINPDRADNDLMMKKRCQSLCRKWFFIRRFSMAVDLLALSKITTRVLRKFANQEFSMTPAELETLQADIDNNASKNMFRRVWDMWPPTINNIYTSDDYDVSFSFRGINFYNNKMKTNLRSYYTNSRYLDNALLSWAGRLAAAGVALLAGGLFN